MKTTEEICLGSDGKLETDADLPWMRHAFSPGLNLMSWQSSPGPPEKGR